MATTGIVVGIVGEGLIVLTALLGRCTKRMIIHVCAKTIAFVSILCAGELKVTLGVFCPYSREKGVQDCLNQ